MISLRPVAVAVEQPLTFERESQSTVIRALVPHASLPPAHVYFRRFFARFSANQKRLNKSVFRVPNRTKHNICLMVSKMEKIKLYTKAQAARDP